MAEYNEGTIDFLIREIQKGVADNTITCETQQESIDSILMEIMALEKCANDSASIVLHLSESVAKLAEMQSKQALIIAELTQSR